MMSDDSLFHRMLRDRHSFAISSSQSGAGPIAQAAQQIAQLKQQGTRKTEELPLTEFDKDFLKDLKVKA